MTRSSRRRSSRRQTAPRPGLVLARPRSQRERQAAHDGARSASVAAAAAWEAKRRHGGRDGNSTWSRPLTELSAASSLAGSMAYLFPRRGSKAQPSAKSNDLPLSLCLASACTAHSAKAGLHGLSLGTVACLRGMPGAPGNERPSIAAKTPHNMSMSAVPACAASAFSSDLECLLSGASSQATAAAKAAHASRPKRNQPVAKKDGTYSRAVQQVGSALL